MTDYPRNTPALDTWTVYASSGEYQVTSATLGHAYLDFIETRPDDFVSAIACDAMEPALVLADEPTPSAVPTVAETRVADVLVAFHGSYLGTCPLTLAELAGRLIRDYPDVRAAAEVPLEHVTSALDDAVAKAVRHMTGEV